MIRLIASITRRLTGYRYVVVDINTPRSRYFGVAKVHQELARDNLEKWRERI